MRYFLWADGMRDGFERALKLSGLVDISSSDGFNVVMYMSLWYGCLFVVVEGWLSLGLRDDGVDNLLSSPELDLLRRYRNAAFHYQDAYLHEKFMTFIREGESSATWVRELHQAFGHYFEVKFGTLPEWRDGQAVV